jgi:hypothetical protein
VVVLANELDMKVKPRDTIDLSASGTSDPDGDELNFQWWYYKEAGSFPGEVEFQNPDMQDASFTVPEKFHKGQNIHIICEVTDAGSPPITRYQRLVLETDIPAYPENFNAELTGITRVALSWDGISGDESGIRIERAEGETGSFASVAEVGINDTAYVDSSLAELTMYRYRVVAFNDSLTSAYDKIVSVSTLSTTSLPVAVSSPSPENNAIDVVWHPTLIWEASINADSYDVYFGEENPPPLITNQSETQFETDTLEDGITYYWRIDGKNTNGTTEGTVWNFTTEKDYTSIPGAYRNGSLQIRASPNPFHSYTTISYELKSRSKVELDVYNLVGEKVATLVNQWKAAGEQSIVFNAAGLEAGIYIIRIKAGAIEQRSKIVLMD